MKNSKADDINTRPTLDKLKNDYTEHPNGNLAEVLDKLADAKFNTEDLEYVFQLMESELRKTDSIAVKSALELLKSTNTKRWGVIVKHSREIEQGTVNSVVSHQLIALIELVAEE